MALNFEDYNPALKAGADIKGSNLTAGTNYITITKYLSQTQSGVGTPVFAGGVIPWNGVITGFQACGTNASATGKLMELSGSGTTNALVVISTNALVIGATSVYSAALTANNTLFITSNLNSQSGFAVINIETQG